MINKFYRLMGRVFGKPLNIQQYADQAIMLCPQEEQDVPPAVYLPEQLHRVSGYTTNFLERTPIERMKDSHVVHAPTLLYSIGCAKLFRGGLWTRKNEFFSRRTDEGDGLEYMNLNQAVVTDTDIGHEHFGHWMREVIPASLIGTPEIPSLSLRRPNYVHASQYAEMFKMQTIYANKGTIENLYLLSDFSQNSHKLKRYLTIRENLKNSLNPTKNSFKGVFIARGQSGSKRALLNEPEVIAHLEQKGFDVIYPEKMTSEQIARRIWGTDMVVTVEGSAHNHAIYSMSQNGALLNLQPPSRFGIIIKNACDCLGIRWGFYVCAPSNDGEGFYVDSFDDLDRVIGQLHDSR